MHLAYTMQKFQDWFTQQWVILWGRQISPSKEEWLVGPFGEITGIGEDFILQLAEKENLTIVRNVNSKGILTSIESLYLKKYDQKRLSSKVIDFYEQTADYELELNVKWNFVFKFFGLLVNRLFSERINQLNIPLKNIKSEPLTSEIIELINLENNEVKYTIWLRKFEKSKQIIYSGIYGTCILPDKQTCIKAVFPLPKGNATVIMMPSVGKENELILDSRGIKFGDAGFYFLLNDRNNNYWAQFIPSFIDKLIVREIKGNIEAQQTLKLWGCRVVDFNYQIKPRWYKEIK